LAALVFCIIALCRCGAPCNQGLVLDGGRAGAQVVVLHLARPQVAQLVMALVQVDLLVEADSEVDPVVLEVGLVEPGVALVEVEAYFDPVDE
jgi:hypothetical protein